MTDLRGSTGQWGISSDIASTFGSTDVSCHGLTSSSGTYQVQESATVTGLGTDRHKGRHTTIAAAVAAGVGSVILLGIVSAWLCVRRKHAHQNGTAGSRGISPLPLTGAPHIRQSKLALPPSRCHRQLQTSQIGYDTLHAPTPWAPTLPTPSLTSLPQVTQAPSHSTSPMTVLEADLQPNIIIQHRDGGIVQELPPPYAELLSRERRPAHLTGGDPADHGCE